jgi:hypothetical protein
MGMCGTPSAGEAWAMNDGNEKVSFTEGFRSLTKSERREALRRALVSIVMMVRRRPTLQADARELFNMACEYQLQGKKRYLTVSSLDDIVRPLVWKARLLLAEISRDEKAKGMVPLDTLPPGQEPLAHEPEDDRRSAYARAVSEIEQRVDRQTSGPTPQLLDLIKLLKDDEAGEFMTVTKKRNMSFKQAKIAARLGVPVHRVRGLVTELKALAGELHLGSFAHFLDKAVDDEDAAGAA